MNTRSMVTTGHAQRDDIKISVKVWDSWYQIQKCFGTGDVYFIRKTTIKPQKLLQKHNFLGNYTFFRIIPSYWAYHSFTSVKLMLLLIKMLKNNGTKYGTFDIKNWGKLMGHWYQNNYGVPLSAYCVYSVNHLFW